MLSCCFACLEFLDSNHKCLQSATGVAEFAQGLGFDLADALAGYLEGLADLFERVFGAVFKVKIEYLLMREVA